MEAPSKAPADGPVLVDTDVLIDHLRGYAELAISSGTGRVSVVTRAELFAGPEAQLGEVARLLSAMVELELSAEVAERAGKIRRTTGILLPDALIAATGLSHGLPVMTRNRRDFERVDGLRLIDPPSPAEASKSAQT